MLHDLDKLGILPEVGDPVRPGLTMPAKGGGLRWQEEMKQAIRDPAELCRVLDLPVSFIHSAQRVAAEGFRLLVPRSFAAKMRPGDPHDPLLRQVLPAEEELLVPQGFTHDPVGDLAAQATPGMLHKYAGRVLLVTTGACAIHCRYCFRRHFPYSEGPRSPEDWSPALAQIAADETIDEVILSGGDPLMLVDAQLAELARRIEAISHVRRLRVHTRLPIVLPSRVTGELLAWLHGTRLTPLMIVHANHPRELDAPVAAALGRLVDAGVPVLNQAVLLRGVNDDADMLTELCRRLVDLRVMPYYLHQLDRVAGAAHFEASRAAGLGLLEELRRRLPGYAVPRYVSELPGGTSKEPVV